MNKILLALLVICAGLFSAEAAKKVKSPGNIPEYTIEGAGARTGGEDFVKVSIMAKKKGDITEEQLAKAAVHGVLFKGYSNSSVQGYGEASNHPAIAGSPNAFEQHLDFYQPFFENGDYMKYVRFMDAGRSTTKVGNLYRISAKIKVATGQLTKDMGEQGVAKRMKDGF